MILETKDFDIFKIAESGQCFRINEDTDHLFNVIHKNRYLEIRAVKTDPVTHISVLELSCDEDEYKEVWQDYFDMHQDYDTIACMIDSKDDYLKAAYEYGRGIRILNQDPWEMLISFIISQRKSIPAIKTSIERLSRACGDRIDINGAGFCAANGKNHVYAFPAPHQILSLSEKELNDCGLGYRTKYITDAAENVLCGKLDIYGLKDKDDDELRAGLMAQYGVGSKVANCIMLFGYHRLDAFPEDVWIKRALADKYPEGFPYELYSGYGGIMQQYIFFYARNNM